MSYDFQNTYHWGAGCVLVVALPGVDLLPLRCCELLQHVQVLCELAAPVLELRHIGLQHEIQNTYTCAVGSVVFVLLPAIDLLALRCCELLGRDTGHVTNFFLCSSF